MSKTIEIKFNVSDGNSFSTIKSKIKEISDVVESTQQSTKGFSDALMNLVNTGKLLDNITGAFGELSDTVSGLADAYSVQETNEMRLAQVMRNTMGATDAEIESIKAFCSAQQELGVVGVEQKKMRHRGRM